MIAAAMFHLHCGCMAMDWQAFYKFKVGLDPPLSGIRVALDVPKYHKFGIMQPQTTLCCKALPVDLMVAATMFHLPYGCMALDWQAFYMLYRPGSTPFRPQSSLGCAKISQVWHNITRLTSCNHRPHYVAKLFMWTWWLLLPCSICLVGVWYWIDKLSTSLK